MTRPSEESGPARLLPPNERPQARGPMATCPSKPRRPSQHAPAWASVGGVLAQAVGASFWTASLSRRMQRQQWLGDSDPPHTRGDRLPMQTTCRDRCDRGGAGRQVVESIHFSASMEAACGPVSSLLEPLVGARRQAQRPVFRHAAAQDRGRGDGAGDGLERIASPGKADRPSGRGEPYCRFPFESQMAPTPCGILAFTPCYPIFIDRSRSALATTDTELRLMAAAAIIGLSSRWLESG